MSWCFEAATAESADERLQSCPLTPFPRDSWLMLYRWYKTVHTSPSRLYFSALSRGVSSDIYSVMRLHGGQSTSVPIWTSRRNTLTGNFSKPPHHFPSFGLPYFNLSPLLSIFMPSMPILHMSVCLSATYLVNYWADLMKIFRKYSLNVHLKLNTLWSQPS